MSTHGITTMHRFILLLLTVVTASGCKGPADSGAALSLEAESTAPAVEGRLTVLNVEPVVYHGTGNAFVQELLEDGGFEKSDPTRWEVIPNRPYEYPNEWRYHGDKEVFAKIDASEEGGGAFALHIVPIVRETRLSQTTAALVGDIGGAWLTVKMDALADAPNSLGLLVRYVGSKGEVNLGVAHPGGSQWHELRIHRRLPDWLNPRHITVEIIRRPSLEWHAIIDNVSARLSPASTDVAGRELLVNRTFDERGWYGKFEPWRISTWGVPKNSRISIKIDESEPNRIHVVAFPKLDGGPSIGMTLRQEVRGLDESIMGKTLTARVWAKSNVPGEIVLILRYVLDNAWAVKERAGHPGDGEWQLLSVKSVIPKDEYPVVIHFEIIRKALSLEQPLVDDASLIAQ